MTDQPSALRVAVVDVDSGFLQVLGKRMQRAGWSYSVHGDAVASGDLVGMRLNAVVVNLAILGGSAWEYLESVCSALPGLAVIVCTGQSSVAQRVRGLRMGADDWVTKPCHPEEVIARIEAVVRRRQAAALAGPGGPDPVLSGELSVRPDHFQAYVGETSVELTRREFELLQLLAAAEGRVLEREDVYQRVWGYAMARGDRSVDVFVRKLRQKLEKASPGWRYIHTHFGVGYRFAAEPADPGAAAVVPAAAEATPAPAVPPVDAPSAPSAPPAVASPAPGEPSPHPLARALS